MVIDKDGNISTVYQEGGSIVGFFNNLKEAYPALKGHHLIVNLSALGHLKPSDVTLFQGLSESHRANAKSFVIVTEALGYEDAPEDLCVVPTLQEAQDIIEMEEIERDLGF